MKKLLLTSAIVGAAFVASPAMAEVSLGLGGHMKGYVAWNDQDEGPTVGDAAQSLDIIRETEIHFTGETTLDNGLTVGFHAEAETDTTDSFDVEESYAYFAGNWGRVNFGGEDGAAYLLQVAAPAADTNVDGIRSYVDAVNYTAGAVDAPFVGLGGAADPFDYGQDDTAFNDKITYITPVFSGFQAGFSYTPDNTGEAGSFGVDLDDRAATFADAYEGALRYEGQFNAVRVALGGGYTYTDLEANAAANDEQKSWNLGANLGFGPFNVGAAYLNTDNLGGLDNTDRDTWTVGVDYTTGPFVLGASYYSRDTDNRGGVAGADLETERYSGGVTYTYGPGMTFRGSVHHIEHEQGVGVGSDLDATSVLLGTQIGF